MSTHDTSSSEYSHRRLGGTSRRADVRSGALVQQHLDEVQDGRPRSTPLSVGLSWSLLFMSRLR